MKRNGANGQIVQWQMQRKNVHKPVMIIQNQNIAKTWIVKLKKSFICAKKVASKNLILQVGRDKSIKIFLCR